jgi:glycosyltransferase involved in cell wall biosynthesis
VIAQYLTSRTLPDRVQAGALDGYTIMRYAHIYRERNSGGVEQYLAQLDGSLLHRHRLTIIRMHLVSESAPEELETESVGLGRIVWAPVRVRHSGGVFRDLPQRIAYLYRRAFDWHVEHGDAPPTATVAAVSRLLRQHTADFRYRTSILSDRLPDVVTACRPDLVVLHWVSYDAGALIAHSRKAGIPLILVNHFDNARFTEGRVKAVLRCSTAVASVSAVGIPDDLAKRCVPVADAVDAEFFSPEKASRVSLPEGARSILFLPARVHPGKGHKDLIDAARLLANSGIDATVMFAGAVVSEALLEDLRLAAAATPPIRLICLGDRSPSEVRDLYAASTVVALPSYSEGLPRVVLEAQAMGKPVVAYDSGGVREALIPGRTGFVVNRGDVKCLADRIRLLVSDESLRSRFGKCARSFILRHFGVPALVNSHEKLYLNALQCRNRDTSMAQMGVPTPPPP